MYEGTRSIRMKSSPPEPMLPADSNISKGGSRKIISPLALFRHLTRRFMRKLPVPRAVTGFELASKSLVLVADFFVEFRFTIIFLQIPSTILTVIHFLFFVQTFVPLSTIIFGISTTTSLLSFTNLLLQGSDGSPSLLTIMFADCIVLRCRSSFGLQPGTFSSSLRKRSSPSP